MFLDRFSHIFIAFQRLGTIVHYLRGFVRRPGIIFHVFSNVFDVRGQYFVYFQRFSMSWVSFSFFQCFSMSGESFSLIFKVLQRLGLVFHVFVNVWANLSMFLDNLIFRRPGIIFRRLECLRPAFQVQGQFFQAPGSFFQVPGKFFQVQGPCATSQGHFGPRGNLKMSPWRPDVPKMNKTAFFVVKRRIKKGLILDLAGPWKWTPGGQMCPKLFLLSVEFKMATFWTLWEPGNEPPPGLTTQGFSIENRISKPWL